MSAFSIVRATVTDNRDPDQIGRVRVRYHWFGDNDSGKQQSEWAPVLREVSHNKGGSWSLPDVGDEVVVGFEFNNQSAPLVLGSIFTKNNKPPGSGKAGDANGDGKNTLRFVKTRSGHLLAFDDTDGSRSITLQDGAGSQILMDTEKGEVLIHDKSQNKISLTQIGATVEDKNGNKITLDSHGVTIKSSSEIHIGEGAAEALVKGNAFMQLFNTHTHGTAVGPSSPPSTPMTPGKHVSMKVKTL